MDRSGKATPERTGGKSPVRSAAQSSLCLAALGLLPRIPQSDQRPKFHPLISPYLSSLLLSLPQHFSEIIVRQLYQTVAGPCPRAQAPDPRRVACLVVPSRVCHANSSSFSNCPHSLLSFVSRAASLGGIINAALALWCEEGAAWLPLLFSPRDGCSFIAHKSLHRLCKDKSEAC